MTEAEAYAKFQESRQAAVKLDIALREGFRQELPESHRKAYEEYLKKRIRPAILQCTRQENTDTLTLLESRGWMDGVGLEEFLDQAAAEHKNASLVWLLRRKEREFGFHRPDYSL